MRLGAAPGAKRVEPELAAPQGDWNRPAICYNVSMSSIDADVAEKKIQLDKLRPVSGKSLAALAAWYDVELTYSSNAIEGNTLTRAETAIVLEKGITVSGKPLRDHMEAIDHMEALGYVRQLAASPDPIRENDVRQIHSLVMGRVDPQGAGRYSDQQRLISGTSYVPPTPAEVVPLMGDFGRWLAKAPATAETAVTAHERVAMIHPFEDGNGRTARLLMNLVLMKGGYPPVVIGPEHRPAYIDGLNTLSVGRDPLAYRQFMADRLEASLDHHLDILRRGLEKAPKQAPGPKP